MCETCAAEALTGDDLSLVPRVVQERAVGTPELNIAIRFVRSAKALLSNAWAACLADRACADVLAPICGLSEVFPMPAAGDDFELPRSLHFLACDLSLRS